ncbi:tyrosine-type recombinase/integrase [Candidatus Micrarchaeota archaeon]|nr:tyrosine-type recombinase/integrase [Candidatus Micrarchaeota archaeon]MBD3417861.1 tyrosine-type recombinase/integrase [Candidatus Micrarchaeota archaeon]
MMSIICSTGDFSPATAHAMTSDVRSDTLNVSGFRFSVPSLPVPGFGGSNGCAENNQCQTRELSVSGPEFSTRKEAQAHIRINWRRIKKELDFLARYASKDKLAEAVTIFSESRKSRFLRRRTPKYGSMNKGFTDEELQKFFNAADDPRMHLLFSYQAILGLRIGEAVRIHIKDINLKTRELRIETEKAKTLDFLLIPEQLFNATLSYIHNFETEITKAGGFLFFVESRHLSISYARQKFNKYIRKARLYETYGFSNDPTPRTLTRLTTHSLRHYAITNHSKKNNGNVVLVNKFARHSNLQTTMTYIHTEKEELYQSIRNSQAEGVLEKVKKMQQKL